MDMMQIRKMVIGQMANNGHVRMASGEFVHVSGIAYLNHNLGSKKILVIMQRVESDHANINTTNQFQSIMLFGATVDLLELDEQQTYSLNGGTQAHFDRTALSTNGSYSKGTNPYFPSATGSYPTNAALGYAERGITPEDANGASDNTVRVYPTYGLTPGRWVWRAYALD